MAALKEAFERSRPHGEEPGTAPSKPPGELPNEPAFGLTKLASALRRLGYRRIIKMLLGLAIVLATGFLPVRALLETTSTEAVINARLITLRAPIEGDIAALPGAPPVGSKLEKGALLMRILNPRADSGRLDELRRLIDRLAGERQALISRREDLAALHGELSRQTLLFKEGRTRQLEARVAELKSEIAAAAATREEAERALSRSSQLAESGAVTRAALDKVERDRAVAVATHLALLHRLEAVDVELATLVRGAFVGDQYNDQPRSQQRADEVAERLSEVASDIREHEARLAGLSSDLKQETERQARLASADLIAPVRSTVWEVMTAPGESVVRGQDLARLLDCSGLVVTATVGETAYNQLRVGQGARFRFRGESVDYEGSVIGLTGVATAPANLAIQPAALAREPYRVTVAVPSLVTPEQCAVGRTGRVTFAR